MMTPNELKKWAETQAEDSLRYGVEPLDALKKSIAEHLMDAYQTGTDEERIRRNQQDEEEAPPSMMVG